MIAVLKPQIQIVLAYIGALSLLLAFTWLMVKVYKIILKKPGLSEEEMSLPGIPELVENPRKSIDEDELVVVLAAAAYVARLRWRRPVAVRAVIPLASRAAESTPAWAMAGRLEMTNPRLRR